MSLATLLLSDRIAAIDFKMAESILDRLGYSLQDLALDYGDVVLPEGDISHQLWYDSIDNSCTILGYVNVENGIYWAKSDTNRDTPEQAALDLLNPVVVEDCRFAIELERSMAVDYM